MASIWKDQAQMARFSGCQLWNLELLLIACCMVTTAYVESSQIDLVGVVFKTPSYTIHNYVCTLSYKELDMIYANGIIAYGVLAFMVVQRNFFLNISTGLYVEQQRHTPKASDEYEMNQQAMLLLPN